MNPLFANLEIQRFLDIFLPKARRRGKHYFDDRSVFETTCVELDRKYAAKVREGIGFGGGHWKQAFTYDPASKSWMAECECPGGAYCKHIYAAMLALKANAAKLSEVTPVAAPPPKPAAARKKKAAAAVTPAIVEEPQPPPSPLADAVRAALGRPLKKVEADYVRRIQWNAQQTRNGYPMLTDTLRQFAPELRDMSWTALTIWPERPPDDFHFWLYCAWELKRRGLSIPDFMVPATNLALIEPVMKAWERQKAIDVWRANFSRHAHLASETAAEPEPVDFRLMILSDSVRVQWKHVSEPNFKDLKQTHLRKLGDDYQAGALGMVPAAIELWLAIYKPYDQWTACNLTYDQPETVKALRRVLRNPGLADRITNAAGAPLERPSEPLIYKLDPAQDESDDYHVALRLADGSPAPPILLALPGRPNLYLTEKAVFQGPPPHGFSVREPLRIPAPALETLPGVDFLQGLKLDLPPRISERVRRVEVVVNVHCELGPSAPGSDGSSVFIGVVAEFDRGETEICGQLGFEPPLNQKPKKKAADDGLIPLIDRSAQRHFPGLLTTLGAKWDGYPPRWRVRVSKTFPEVFVSWLASLPPEVRVHLDRELATLRDEPVSGSVRLDVEEAGVDWFDLKVALNVSDLSLTQSELKLLLNAQGRFVRLGDKGWRRLKFDFTPEEDERLARLGLNARDFTAEPQRLHTLQLADEATRKFLPEAQVEKIHRRVAELKTRVTPAVPDGISAQLRPYQLEGFHFLAYLTANRFGGVLADDMGLGKTLQTLTWLLWLRQGGVDGTPVKAAPPGEDNVSDKVEDKAVATTMLPSLVVCPKSVMDNWHAEARRFYAGLRVRLWRGEGAGELAAARAEADLIVINYPQLRSLSPDIAGFRWQVVILDEAQYIKNPDSQTAQSARALQADHRLALSGTPIENRLLDLWSILAFAMPGVLGNRAQFGRQYDQKDDPFARRRLSARVRPFLLRRAKSQVAQDLPDRIEEDLSCEMEGEQKTLYRAEFKRAQALLLGVTTQKELNEQRFNFLTSLLRLRQICCHPALISESLRKAESAKLNALQELLEPLMEEGHKVLVFSQFVTMLDILRDTMKERGWQHFYLAGETENRGDLVAEFQSSQGAAVFLISLKAGGFGLNLTAASYVVLFDPWWNPAVEMQAIDRTHRIGQTSKVIAYRLLMKDSIEQKIRQLQRAKAALAEDVLGEEKFSQSLTLDDLRFLFAEG